MLTGQHDGVRSIFSVPHPLATKRSWGKGSIFACAGGESRRIHEHRPPSTHRARISSSSSSPPFLRSARPQNNFRRSDSRERVAFRRDAARIEWNCVGLEAFFL